MVMGFWSLCIYVVLPATTNPETGTDLVGIRMPGHEPMESLCIWFFPDCVLKLSYVK